MSTDNVIHPAAFLGKPVVVNPPRKGGHATRMKGVIGLRNRRQLRQREAKWEEERKELKQIEREAKKAAQQDLEKRIADDAPNVMELMTQFREALPLLSQKNRYHIGRLLRGFILLAEEEQPPAA